MRHDFLRSIVTAVVLAVLLAVAPAAQQTLNLQDTIPFDSAVRTATLPNGLQYFVRRNEQPQTRVSLRLAVKAGSMNEADDQQGLAHLIEHMAFNGSTHFKPGALVSYFESTGARLGPHVNAYTSFDETVYMLDLPTDKPDIVAKGLTALAECLVRLIKSGHSYRSIPFEHAGRKSEKSKALRLKSFVAVLQLIVVLWKDIYFTGRTVQQKAVCSI